MLAESRPDAIETTTGYAALEGSAAWLNLPGRGLLSVAGPDRLRFLNAMVTADLRALIPGEGCYTLLLDARGRVIADATVHAIEEAYLLDTEAGNAGALFTHLDRYLIADEVQLENQSFLFSCIGVEGPRAKELLQTVEIPQPKAVHGAVRWDGGWVTRTSLTGAPGFRLFLSTGKREAVFAALENVELALATHDDVRAIRLEHGKPRWGEEITPRYLGPETGLAQAIARSKGCYLGQEVVERIRSRRLLGRVLVPVSVATTEAVRMGEKVLAGQKRVGVVASAVFSPHLGQVVGFAYLQTEFLNGGHELVCESSRAVVSIRIELASEVEI